ncbi:gamma-glutamyl phosphate reductase [Bacteroidia bacterium]|nr:gamma-glutamyl phosphate reductase [Bacteroidia bacterium]
MELQTKFRLALEASRALQQIDAARIGHVLGRVADRVVLHTDEILAANERDLARMEPTDPKYDRLLLTRERIAAVAEDMRAVAGLASPVGETLSVAVRPNGMKISKVRVPFGVIGVIYEARPNVTLDVFSLCFKTQNACVLRGGKEAEFSNLTTMEAVHDVLREEGIDQGVATLLPVEREATAGMLAARGFIDLIIPRGSQSLIDFVRENSRVPVIETGAGVCHTYFDQNGDAAMGARIVFNAKTRRVSVCNSLDTLVIHAARLDDLAAICHELATRNVEILADRRAFGALEGRYPAGLLRRADETSFGTEFLDYKMSVCTVDSLDEAIDHITRHGSKHSETIVTGDEAAAREFLGRVDAACVYHNVSTAFTDGGQFGFGAEIGISTQKLHARGPMGLPELTSYKYLIEGDGQVRS